MDKTNARHIMSMGACIPCGSYTAIHSRFQAVVNFDAGDKVLSVCDSSISPGPFCTMILSDLGAEVIKVEIPGTGDDSRAKVPEIGEHNHLIYHDLLGISDAELIELAIQGVI